MTEKQEKILTTAMTLFAHQGFASTSTSQVAREAGVSEGLIFRHFNNKEGLLNAILQQGLEKIEEMFRYLGEIEDPKEILRQILKLPFNIPEDQKSYWKLMYSLKWQAEVYDNSMTQPIKDLLIPAFQKLGYEDPESEAEAILITNDGLATAILLRKPYNLQGIVESIFRKYDL